MNQALAMEILFKQAAGLLTEQDREAAAAIVAEASAGPPDLVAPVLVNELTMGGIDVPANAAARSYAEVAPEDVVSASLEQLVEGGRGLNPSSPSGTAQVLGNVADTLESAMGEFSAGISSALGSGWQGQFADQALDSVGRYAQSGTALADELRTVASKSSTLAGGYETTRSDVEQFADSHMAGLREADFHTWAAHLVNVNYNPHLIDANLSGASFTAAYPVVVGGAGGTSGIAALNNAGAATVSGLAESGTPRVQAAVEGVSTPFRAPTQLPGGVDAQTTTALRGEGMSAAGAGPAVAVGAGGVGTNGATATALDGSRGQSVAGAGAAGGLIPGAATGVNPGANPGARVGAARGTGNGIDSAVRPASANQPARAGAGTSGAGLIGPGGVIRGGTGGGSGGRNRANGFGAAGQTLGAGGGLVGAGTLAGGAANALGSGQTLGGMRGPTGLVTPPLGGFGAGGVGAGGIGAGGIGAGGGAGGGPGAGTGGVGTGTGGGAAGSGAGAGGGAGGPGGANAGATSSRGVGPMGMMPAGAMGAGQGDRRGGGVPSYLVDATNTSELLGTAPKVSPSVIGRRAATGEVDART